MTTTTADGPDETGVTKRPPRRPAAGGRVIWNGEPLTAAGDIIVQEDTQVVPIPGELAAAPEDEEDEDDLEDEDEEDEDDEDGETDLVASTAEAIARPRPAPRSSRELPPMNMDSARPAITPLARPGFGGPGIIPTQAELRSAKAEVEETIAEKMAGYDLTRGEFTFTLMRVKPVLWKGKEIDGHLQQYEAPLSETEVKTLFGGGAYKWQVYGPDPKNPGRKVMHKPIPFKISGDPIVVDHEEAAKNSDIGLFRDVMKTRNEEVERMRKETEATRLAMEKKVEQAAARSENATKEILDVVMQFVNPKGAKDMALAERLAADKKSQDEREERRRENESAERRHKESMDAAERRFQQSLQESRQQHEKDMERMRQETSRALDTVKASEKSSTGSLETMMKWQAQMSAESMERQSKMSAEAEQRAREANTAMLAGLQTLNNTKEEFLLKMVDKKDEDPMEKMLKLKQFMDLFNPGEKSKDGWDRAFDVFERVGPNVVPGIMGAISAARGAPAAPQPQRFIPGSVAAVDLPNAPALRTGKRKKRRPGQPGKPTTAGGQPTTNQVAATAPPVDVVTELANAAAAQAQPPPIPADMEWAPVFPPDDMANPEDVIRMLIGNLEQAAQRDWTTERIFTEVLKRFPTGILELLKMATPEQAIETVTKGVPDDWALKGIRGRGLITDLMTMLKGG